uniref:Mitochondrial fission 1 protein n=1 Tax=Ciona intestinalis TaxID=7719 RepID=H2Y1A3_CIOIN|nr:mitochondrial fission 1 protein-like [Ciona intestinalis]|eukprot:XP_002121705.1 mitochondrial fission 1 protein-like [Ciona intestinalis]
MEGILSSAIDPQEIMKFEKKYKKEEVMGQVSSTTAFEYAWCLIRSRYSDDWKQGFSLLKKLYEKERDGQAKRDYLYYMAVAKYRLKEYEEALKFCDAILKVEPKNHQVKELKEIINRKMKGEGLLGMAMIGGAGLVVGLGVAVIAAVAATRK